MFKVIIGVMLIVASLFAAVALSQEYGSVAVAGGVPVRGPEQLSPTDRVDSGQIIVMSNGIMIRDLENVRLVNLADTNSMDPVLDAESTAIEIVPASADEIRVGDIVSYKTETSTIIHRVIAIGDDGEWYAIVKGDNNSVPDQAKVRFEQIKGVVVGIVY